MGEEQIRVSETGTTIDPTVQDPGRLTLTGICSEGTNCTDRHPNGNATVSDDDDFIYFGGSETDTAARPAAAETSERYAGGKQVTLQRGDTFWKLAEQQYGGKHPIEAIYAANGLYPKATEKDGRIELTDPQYFAGRTYTLPDSKDIETLTQQYRGKVEQLGKHSDKRVGDGETESKVKLIYGDTFHKLAQAKYDKQVPMEAIFEANGLKATETTKDGKTSFKDPIYFAGREYTLPAEKDIPELVRKYWDRMGRPEKCPPEYRRGGGTQPAGDNYGDYGEPGERPQQRPDAQPPRDNYGDYGEAGQRPQQGPEAVPPVRDQRPNQGEVSDGRNQRQADYDLGYEDGYEDGVAAGEGQRRDGEPRRAGCDCGGAGCSACSGWNNYGPPRRRQGQRR